MTQYQNRLVIPYKKGNLTPAQEAENWQALERWANSQVANKIIAGTNVTLSSQPQALGTGAQGSGIVTVSVPGGGTGPQGPQGTQGPQGAQGGSSTTASILNVYLNASPSFTLPSATPTQIVFNETRATRGSAISYSTATGVATINTTGNYLVAFQVLISPLTAGKEFAAYVTQSTEGYLYGNGIIPDGVGGVIYDEGPQWSGQIACTAGDTLTVTANTNATGSPDVLNGIGITFFNLYGPI